MLKRFFSRAGRVARPNAVNRRGLTGARLVISDRRSGLVKPGKRSVQDIAHQQGQVHVATSLLAHVPKSHADTIAAVSHTILPNHASVIRLVGGVVADMHDEWHAGYPRYLSERSIALPYSHNDNGALAAIDGGE